MASMTIHSVNARGSDEYSVHEIRDDSEPRVLAIVRKSSKSENRRRAIAYARILAEKSGCAYQASHNLSERALFDLLPALVILPATNNGDER